MGKSVTKEMTRSSLLMDTTIPRRTEKRPNMDAGEGNGFSEFEFRGGRGGGGGYASLILTDSRATDKRTLSHRRKQQSRTEMYPPRRESHHSPPHLAEQPHQEEPLHPSSVLFNSEKHSLDRAILQLLNTLGLKETLLLVRPPCL